MRARPRTLRVIEGWAEALEAANSVLWEHGAATFLHRGDCGAPGGVCECQVVQIGPAVRAYAAGWA